MQYQQSLKSIENNAEIQIEKLNTENNELKLKLQQMTKQQQQQQNNVVNNNNNNNTNNINVDELKQNITYYKNQTELLNSKLEELWNENQSLRNTLNVTQQKLENLEKNNNNNNNSDNKVITDNQNANNNAIIPGNQAPSFDCFCFLFFCFFLVFPFSFLHCVCVAKLRNCEIETKNK